MPEGYSEKNRLLLAKRGRAEQAVEPQCHRVTHSSYPLKQVSRFENGYRSRIPLTVSYWVVYLAPVAVFP